MESPKSLFMENIDAKSLEEIVGGLNDQLAKIEVTNLLKPGSLELTTAINDAAILVR